MRCLPSDVKFTEYSPTELDLGFAGGLAAMPVRYQQTLAGLARSIVASNPRGRVISVSGSQGSGKSTLSAYLVDLLRERYGFEPVWVEAAPDLPAMLAAADAAGDYEQSAMLHQQMEEQSLNI